MRKLLFLVSLLSLLCFSFLSCEENQDGEQERLIYDGFTDLYVRYDKNEFLDYEINAVTDKLYDEGLYPRSIGADYAPQAHEIVIGEVGTEISDIAYKKLREIETDGEDDGRFLIYCDGASIAIAYDVETGNFTRKIAIDYFLENYVRSELYLKAGVVHSEHFDLIEYLGAQDAAYVDGLWNKMSDTLGEGGEEVVEAFKSLYELYDGEAIIRWLTSLYDPEICICNALYGKTECENTKYCGGGGFYYSKSGRDNVGFAPDAESCAQAISIIRNCGMTRGLRSGGYYSIIPDEMADSICDYLYELQEDDGFFYHPQWNREYIISENKLSRRGRDNSWCTQILHDYGRAKKYRDVKASSFKVENALTESLGGSSVTAVSKVISTADFVVAPHLETLDAFKQYLKDLDIANNSYPAGNTLSAQGSQIQARGREYVDAMVEELLRIYNDYGNGTWHHTVDYYAINGVMKLVGQLTGAGVEIPKIDLTARACFAAIGSEEEVEAIVDIWNPWVAFNRVLDNMEKCSENGKEKVAALKAELYPDYAEAIRDTKEKLGLFRKEDGSFSYFKNRSSHTSQAVFIALPNQNEGDVNATVLGTNNFTYEIFTLVNPMGISRLPFAGLKERYIFYKLLDEAQPIRKSAE